MANTKISSDVLVIGAGIAGVSTALELAETGYTVTLIEKQPFIGGRVARMNLYFPKLCPPQCGMEINMRRLKDNPNITLYTLAETESIDGSAGDYKVNILVKPRYIKDSATDTECEAVAKEISIERDNEFNLGMDKNKAVYLPFNNAYPMRYVLDKDVCSDEDLKFLAENFKNVIDLQQQDEVLELGCKAIVVASGWKPYDAAKLTKLSFGKFDEVVTNVMMERLASPSGPTEGKILVPGTDKAPEKIAFCQCAGSRDENHLEYCSSICCLASMKQARYVREQYPDAEIHIFYIDIRSTGIYDEFYYETEKDEKIFFHRGKVAKIIKPHGSDKVVVEAEDTMSGDLKQLAVDMAVLATGMQPTNDEIKGLDKSLLDKSGFIRNDLENGIYGCGVASRPQDVAGVVREATGAAIKAIHTVRGSK